MLNSNSYRGRWHGPVLLRRVATYALSALTIASSPGALAFQDPVNAPAKHSAFAANAPLLAAARAGERIVAVGSRGHIVFSDDQGKTWTQASVPVSTDLLALSFPNSKQGWAVGHGGVVLHTSDGGATWVKQLDGQRASEIAIAYYEARVAETPTPELKRILEQARGVAKDGSTRAFLDVYFPSASSGFIVGTFNRVFRTEDGGKTWTPWMHRTDNPNEFHFYSIRGDSERVVMTGEQGMVWELDAQRERFEARPTPYKGTLFGSVRAGSNLLVFGMRGSLFRSGDNGKSWEKVELPTQAGISGGTALDSLRVVLTSQAGTVLQSSDSGGTFKSVRLSSPMSYFGIAAATSSKLAVVGSNGVKVETLP